MELDTTCFRAFQLAVKTLNFSEAARLGGLTQSGVSQHIAKLERELDCELFLRVGKKVHLTEAGRSLLEFVERHQDGVSQLFEEIHEKKRELKGLVRYSMPDSCLLSPHFSLLLKDKARNFPDVDLKVMLHPSEEVITQVLNHEIDFGFVTKAHPNEALSFEPFCHEDYVLVMPKGRTLAKKSIPDLDWIHYPGLEPIAEKWLADQSIRSFDFKFTGHTNGLRAALLMVSHGMGVTVLPRHCVESFDDKKNIYILEEGAKASRNMIYIVTLRGQQLPMRVQKVIEVFRKMKN